jgi:hypothetical protein
VVLCFGAASGSNHYDVVLIALRWSENWHFVQQPIATKEAVIRLQSLMISLLESQFHKRPMCHMSGLVAQGSETKILHLYWKRLTTIKYEAFVARC